MTDTRLPASWLTAPVMDGLSDRAWRSFTGSLMWSNEAGTDGLLPHRAARFFHPEGIDSKTMSELVTAGLWEPWEGGMRIPNWIGLGQESSEVIEQRKANNRIRQQNWRDKQTAELMKPPKVPKGITGDVTRDVGQVHESESDTDSEKARSKPKAENEKPTVSWPVTPIGEGRKVS